MSGGFSAHSVGHALALAAGVAIGVFADRWVTGTVDVSMSRETDGIRCNIELERADGDYLLTSMTVVPVVEPEPCASDWVHCHDGGPCDYGKFCDHCPGCVP